MHLWCRAVAFTLLVVGVWTIDFHYRDAVLAPTARSAVIGQVNGSGATALASVHQQGNLADDAALGGTTLAAIICFGTWRPAPRTVYIDNRNQE